jgi:hypothetical protein
MNGKPCEPTCATDCNTDPEMRQAHFDLAMKSGGWTHHPNRRTDPDARMINFTLVSLMDGQPLGGHNIQAYVGSATARHGPPDDVDLWLSSGWWVAYRNQFAQGPDVASEIFAAVEAELSNITAELEHARGAEMAEASDRLRAMTFHAEAPQYWR